MFGLGVLVGRDVKPVLFETRPFQERLAQMVSELSAKTPEKEKVDLKFYDVLEEPVFHQVKSKTEDSGEITPGPEIGKSASTQPTPDTSQAEEIPVKRSKKLATWYQAGQGHGNEPAPAPPAKKSTPVKTDRKTDEKQTVTLLAPKTLKSKIPTGEKTEAPPKETRPGTGKSPAPADADGVYTIQVASYKNLNDALAQMVLLSKKGITSYRASAKINGDTWYRVRTGSFADYKAASARLAQLAGSGVNAMIIKKE
ncbi:SPOR domain-containing protein [Desulfobacter vibrioformis]|uniref:SPOR domain-containing protein n=1 Tax=Desulfobacter vibrioformis TaxID=34031 RepID=UPI00054DD035|nr:SPOR domain-containing protein [Desulfobacter vibrioformis]